MQIAGIEIAHIDGTVGVGLRMPFIRGVKIVGKCSWRSHIPHGDNKIPLDARRTWRRSRNFSLRNTICPIRQNRFRVLGPQRADHSQHVLPNLPHLNSVIPRLGAGIERAQRGRNLTCGLSPHQIWQFLIVDTQFACVSTTAVWIGPSPTGSAACRLPVPRE